MPILGEQNIIDLRLFQKSKISKIKKWFDDVCLSRFDKKFFNLFCFLLGYLVYWRMDKKFIIRDLFIFLFVNRLTLLFEKYNYFINYVHKLKLLSFRWNYFILF